MTRRPRTSRRERILIVGGSIVFVLACTLGTLLALQEKEGVDWSQFPPDVLSGVIVSAAVGIAVGIYLNSQARGAEDRAEERAALGAWRQARADFGLVISGSMPGDWTSFDEPTSYMSSMMAMSRGHTIGIWYEAARDNTELSGLMKVIENHAVLIRQSADARAWLTSEIRKHAKAAKITDGHWINSLEVSGQYRLLTREMNPATTPGMWALDHQGDLDKILAVPELVDVVDQYKATVKEIRTEWNKLARSLKNPMV